VVANRNSGHFEAVELGQVLSFFTVFLGRRFESVSAEMLLYTRQIKFCLLAAGLLLGFSLVCVAQEPPQQDAEMMSRTIKQLRTENEQLRAKVSDLERRFEALSIRDRLLQEEQRVENLQAQLFALGEKEAGLQGRFDEINEELRPENIDNLPISGSLRPEQVREATRRRLTGEQNRLRSQLELLQQGRTRLQSSLTVTELLVQSLRGKLQTVVRP
jgi:hypothetical protein